MNIERADWVECINAPGLIGYVKRLAADGSWADVDWHTHTKRMQTKHLRPLHTIPFAGGTVTDETRKLKFVEPEEYDPADNYLHK